MTRLTKDMRGHIIGKALEKAGVVAENIKLTHERAKLAEDCRVASLGGKKKTEQVEKVIAEMHALRSTLPDFACERVHVSVQKESSCRIRDQGTVRRLRFSGSVAVDGRGTYKIVGEQPFDLTPALSKRQSRLRDKQDANNLKEDSVRRETAVTLESFNTVKQLLRHWPEAVELLPDVPARNTLPAVPVKNLNTLIGLPSEERTKT